MSRDRHRHLLALLDRHEPSTDDEAGHLGRLIALLDRGPAAFDRDEYEPGHVTASAFVVHPTEASVALVEHRKLGAWLQPGGHVEASDADIVSAARREVAEETGLSDLAELGVVDVDVHHFPPRGGQPGHLHFDVRLGFVARTGDLSHGDESTGIGWFDLGEVRSMDESLARAARRLEAMDRAGTLRPD